VYPFSLFWNPFVIYHNSRSFCRDKRELKVLIKSRQFAVPDRLYSFNSKTQGWSVSQKAGLISLPKWIVGFAWSSMERDGAMT
jgi:hypothetical protein